MIAIAIPARGLESAERAAMPTTTAVKAAEASIARARVWTCGSWKSAIVDPDEDDRRDDQPAGEAQARLARRRRGSWRAGE